MPVLELLDDGMDSARVVAWMLFPTRPDLQRHHLMREEAEAALGAAVEGTVTLSSDAVSSLLRGPGSDEIGRLATEGTKLGTVAGDLVSLYYQMHVFGAEEPSFSKALAEYKEFALGKRYGDGDAMKISEQTLRTYFAEAKAVCHLWAAYRINRGPFAYLDNERDAFRTPDGLRDLLGVAKAIGEFVSSFVPKRTKPPKPLVDPADLLEVPDTVPALRLRVRDH